jgi:mono/diheme cytochrome c family protein
MPKLLIFVLLLCLLPVSARAGDLPMSKGAYLARVGDCTSCHSEPGGKLFAGGFKINAPFGTIYGTNITPDPEYGIGTYSLEDFTRAIRLGIAKDGHRLYPAMPYPSFARMSDEDVKALYDYFMHEVEPVHIQPKQTHLSFPFNQRWGIRFWDWAFAPNKRYQPDMTQDEEWNRGAYLVQSLGHCSACHTPRGIAYEEQGTTDRSSRFLRGETLDYWYAPDLSGDPVSGLGNWPEADIASFLKKGYAHKTAGFGSMQQVVENSTQYLTAEDSLAIAHYLKSLKPEREASSYHEGTAVSKFEHPGAGLYASACAGCHQNNGEGNIPRIPALAGNSAVLSADATSIIRIVLEGGSAPLTSGGLKPTKMPGFGKRFNDAEIADIVTFIRQSWGNNASAVSARQVTALHGALQRQELSETTPAPLQ